MVSASPSACAPWRVVKHSARVSRTAQRRGGPASQVPFFFGPRFFLLARVRLHPPDESLVGQQLPSQLRENPDKSSGVVGLTGAVPQQLLLEIPDEMEGIHVRL